MSLSTIIRNVASQGVPHYRLSTFDLPPTFNDIKPETEEGLMSINTTFGNLNNSDHKTTISTIEAVQVTTAYHPLTQNEQLIWRSLYKLTSTKDSSKLSPMMVQILNMHDSQFPEIDIATEGASKIPLNIEGDNNGG
ncbi:predicted protein [Sclerotinia sclerotiorum 1980 UF-70]|uniref:Uncharacterized protein n=1 Tax=Sclerotinia sclerotiorum (strain ATCC 18683 / 1980 / Ss-1) TaxID=665079 RepID=A7EB33_SCLS1|nr:predicted protein [Sclerotinia sclerotiorum 1980 UF-70]EDN99661.1 predicted protein [Sclerotinia sclerotiorum 1980 UF-70]